MLGEVPRGWSPSTVRDCCDILDGMRVPLNSDQRRDMKGAIPYWGANGIVDYINAHIFDEPLLLMAEDGGYFDEAHSRPICQLVNGKAWVNNHAHVMRVRPKNLREYVYYWFVHRDITPFIKGGTRSKLNQADLYALPVLLPPLPEQKKIAAILSSVDEAIQATQAVIDQTRRVKEGLLQDLLTRGIGHTRFKQTEIGEIPESWEVVGPEGIFNRMRVPRTLDRNALSDSGTAPILDQSADQWFGFHDGPADFYPSEYSPLVTFANHTCSVRYLTIPFSVIQNVFPLRANDGVAPRFLFWMMTGAISQDGYRGHWPEVKRHKFAKPPAHEQVVIAERVDAIASAELGSIAGRDALMKVKSGLLGDLLTGKVRVSP